MKTETSIERRRLLNAAKTARYRVAHPDRVKASYAKWLASHIEQEKERGKRRYYQDPEKARARSLQWGKDNPDKKRERNNKWYSDHPEVRQARRHTYRARKQNNGGVLSTHIGPTLFKLQKGKCPCCGLPLGVDYQLDHKMPLALGGANEDWNMQLLRKLCNMQKSAKHPVDFMKSRGFLL